MDNVEMAQDSLEHAHGHEAHAQAPASTRFAAVLVAVIAATAVVVEMSGNDRQTAYLAHDVAASDLWSQYQGKSVRHTVLLETAILLEGQVAQVGVPSSPQHDAAIAAARAGATRLEDDPAHDGLKQLSARATREEQERDQALHLHEGFERSVRGLQIAIVLIGLFMVTRLTWLLVMGAGLGVVAFAYAVAVWSGLT